jgi:hypothetical protein
VHLELKEELELLLNPDPLLKLEGQELLHLLQHQYNIWQHPL